jgi:hypothetical protein
LIYRSKGDSPALATSSNRGNKTTDIKTFHLCKNTLGEPPKAVGATPPFDFDTFLMTRFPLTLRPTLSKSRYEHRNLNH